MANQKRPRKKIVTEFIDDDGGQEMLPDVPVLPDPDDEVLAGVMSQFAGAGNFLAKIYLMTPQGKDFQYVETDPNAISEEIIRARLNGRGGHYVVHILINGEFRKVINLRAGDDPKALAGGSGGGGSPELMLLRQSLSDVREELRTIRATPPREPMSEMMSAFSQMVVAAQTMIPKQETSNDVFLKGVEFARELLQSKGDDSWTGLFKETVREVGAPLLTTFLSQRGAAPAPAPEAQAALPAATPGPAVTPPNVGGSVGITEQALALAAKQGIAFLKRKALKGSDPALYAETILDNQDEDPRYAYLVNLIRRPEAEFSTFVKLDPEIEQPIYRAFFEGLFHAIRNPDADGFGSDSEESDSMDGDTGRAGGDVRDTPANGTTGKRGGK